MTMKPVGAERFSLARWSRRKLASALDKGAPPAAPAAATAAPAPAIPAVELPPVESLTFDSDFTAFLKPGVDPTLKRAALKKLFRDPRFNVMDGLDVYIDDYTKSDPIPSDMLAGLLDRFDRANAPAGDAEAAREETAVAREAPPVVAASPPPAAPESAPEPTSGEEVPRLAEASSPLADATAARSSKITAEPLPARDPRTGSRQTEGR